ncbi:MAG TPA: polysaccharide biosynthesis/export family protein [Vicinamibacteria bacterium]|nr:polysaccharide biosynthesis/export family protein [Vicinamibacteria bacterium]
MTLALWRLGTLAGFVALAAQASAPVPPPAPPPATEQAPAPFASPSPSTAPAPDRNDYRIGPGDVLEITVLGNADLSRSVTVQPSGSITFPLLNEVGVAGLTVSEVQRKMVTLLQKDFLVDPHVEVKVKEFLSQFVVVIGELNTPGRKVLRGGSRLVDILVEAGGFTPHASGEIVITRTEGSFEGGAKVVRMRLGGAFSAQDYVGLELPLHNGDVITASARQYVTVEGEVQRPGRYAIEGDLTVTGAISTAGGLTRFGSSDVKLRRIESGTGTVTITKVDLKSVRKGKGPDPTVGPNDVITVPRRLF